MHMIAVYKPYYINKYTRTLAQAHTYTNAQSQEGKGGERRDLFEPVAIYFSNQDSFTKQHHSFLNRSERLPCVNLRSSDDQHSTFFFLHASLISFRPLALVDINKN